MYLFLDDLKSLYESLGVENVSDSQFDEMLSEISGQLNHSKFQCMMASRAGDMDDSQVSSVCFTMSVLFCSLVVRSVNWGWQ